MYLDKETITLSDKEILEPKDKPRNFTLVTSDDFAFSLNLSEIINTHFTRSDFTSEYLFSSLGMSKSKATRRVKSLTGMAPNQLVQESRLHRALNNMVQSNKTIAEIAYESGFNSPTYFARVFKKRFGISPTDFSKKQA